MTAVDMFPRVSHKTHFGARCPILSLLLPLVPRGAEKRCGVASEKSRWRWAGEEEGARRGGKKTFSSEHNKTATTTVRERMRRYAMPSPP